MEPEYFLKITTYITDIQFDMDDITFKKLPKFVAKYFFYHNSTPISSICDYKNVQDKFDAFSVMLTP